jgi:hypothetical protein
MDYDECGAVIGMNGKGNWSSWRKPAKVLLCLPQIPHDLTWAQTQAAAVGSQQLSVWAVAWLLLNRNIFCEFEVLILVSEEYGVMGFDTVV